MNTLSNKEFKNMLLEWKTLLNEQNEAANLTFSDIINSHTHNKTLYHLTNYSPKHFSDGLKLNNATSLSTKQNSSSQGSGIYFFTKPHLLEKAFSTNNLDYLITTEIDYKNNPNFLPDFEICAGFFVDWYINNINKLSQQGFKSKIIKNHRKQGDPHPFYPSGSPHSTLIPHSGKMQVLSQYKSYNNFSSESGEIVYKTLQEIKSFNESEFLNAISYIMSFDIDAVKYIGSTPLKPKSIYKLNRNNSSLTSIPL